MGAESEVFMGGGLYPGQVAFARADTYEAAVITEAVRQVMDPFGGATGLLGDRKKVLLKPNVLRPALPEEAVTTHPLVVSAVAKAFLQAGAEVAVGDAPGGDPGPAGPAFEKTGIAHVCRTLDIPLLNFQKEGVVMVPLGDCVVDQVQFAKPVMEADMVVNLPKFKTHTLTQLTCTLKNTYGYIPGFMKGRLHLEAPRIREFADVICAVWAACPPVFSLVDGVVGMEGEGPSSGQPTEVGWLFGGTDPVALDTVAAHAMGYPAGSVHVTRTARRRGLGEGDAPRIQLHNAAWTDFPVADFVLPRLSRLSRGLPRWIAAPLALLFRRLFWARPRVLADKCIKCHRCVRSCPTDAMQAETGGIPGVTRPRHCISCFCCQEMCPAHAIGISKSFVLTRIFTSEEKRMAAQKDEG